MQLSILLLSLPNKSKEIMKNQIKVNKSEYEVFEYMSGYYGICSIGSMGGNPVFGGDSANEDDYNKDYIQGVYDEWDGNMNNENSIN